MRKLYYFLKRVITNAGPHGKFCKCKKWGTYVGFGCPNPNNKLLMNKYSALIGDRPYIRLGAGCTNPKCQHINHGRNKA